METIIENNSAPADANVYRLKCIIRCLIFFYPPLGLSKADGMEFVSFVRVKPSRHASQSQISLGIINFRRNCSLGDSSHLSSLTWPGSCTTKASRDK